MCSRRSLGSEAADDALVEVGLSWLWSGASRSQEEINVGEYSGRMDVELNKTRQAGVTFIRVRLYALLCSHQYTPADGRELLQLSRGGGCSSMSLHHGKHHRMRAPPPSANG
eukprot:scaffold547_cov384-Prasinococcus_capsulatus_cf.AAC.42